MKSLDRFRVNCVNVQQIVVKEVFDSEKPMVGERALDGRLLSMHLICKLSEYNRCLCLLELLNI